MLFPVDKKSVSTCRNEQLAEKYIPVEEWVVFTDSNWLLSEKMEKNGFHQPENQFSTCTNNLPPAGIFFKKLDSA